MDYLLELVSKFQTIIVFIIGVVSAALTTTFVYFKTIRKRSIANETRSKANEKNLQELREDLKEGRREVQECFREIRDEIKQEFVKMEQKVDAGEKKNEEDHARVMEKIESMQKDISETNGEVKVLSKLVTDRERNSK